MTRESSILGLSLALASVAAFAQAHDPIPTCPAAPSQINIERGSFSPAPGITFQLRHFAAQSVPMGATSPGCFQKMTVVAHAEIFVDNASLTTVFREKLGGSEGRIKNFTVENGAGSVSLNGSITKLIPIHFTIQGPVTTDGRVIQLHANKIKADGIPIAALLQMVGDHLSSVLNVKDVKGIAVEGDSISFSPEQIAHLKGNIVAVEPSPNGLTLRYEPKVRVGRTRVSR